MLTNSNKDAVIDGFTETWLENTTEKNNLNIEGYRLAGCRYRTYNRWGSVAVYVHENVPKKRRIPTTWYHKCSMVELSFANSKLILICTVYRTPGFFVEWYDNFTDMYDHAYIEEKEMIMISIAIFLNCMMSTKNGIIYLINIILVN